MIATPSPAMHNGFDKLSLADQYEEVEDTETEFEEYDSDEEEEIYEEIIYEDDDDDESYDEEEIIYEEIIEEIIEDYEEDEPKKPKKERRRSVTFGDDVKFGDAPPSKPPLPPKPSSALRAKPKAAPAPAPAAPEPAPSMQPPPAYQLAMDGEYDLLKEILLSFKEQLDAVYSRNTAPLEKALAKYVNAKDEFGRSALFYACSQNSMSMTMLLLSPPFHSNPNAVDVDGFPPLYVPCERGYVFIVQLLLKFGADANHTVVLEEGSKIEAEEDSSGEEDDDDDPPNPNLWWNLDGSKTKDSKDEKPKKTKKKKKKKKSKADEDPHRNVPSVATPLLAAVFGRREKTVGVLLEHGANPNVVTESLAGKKSALELATEVVPNRAIEQLLYQHGAFTVLSCKPVATEPNAQAAASSSPNDLLPEWMKRFNRR